MGIVLSFIPRLRARRDQLATERGAESSIDPVPVPPRRTSPRAGTRGPQIRILGIDPGSLHTGYGVLDGVGTKWTAVAWGRLSPPKGSPLSERVLFLGDGLAHVIEQHAPDVAVLESPFHGQSSRSLIVLAQARGALLLTVARARIPVVEYAPAEVKAAVTGNGRAEKLQVAKMVSLLLGLESRPPADAADALAVALCYAARVRTGYRLAASESSG